MTQSPSPPRFSATLPATGKPAYLGMWTWLFQRASSLVLMILLPWHWVNPYSRPVRIAVLFFVIFHAAAGVRSARKAPDPVRIQIDPIELR